MSNPQRVLVVGAHPDDCDISCGGTAIRWAERGDDVRFVSATNGDAGHHEQGGVELARRRIREANAAASVAGIEYTVLDNDDGKLRPTLSHREEFIRLIREYDPDLIVTHRPNDYHPDHRYTSQLVQDAAYMVTVPNICPHTPALAENPHIAYLSDTFEKPRPFEPDVVVPVDGVRERKFEMLDCHESQIYEWLAYNEGVLDSVPDDAAKRRRWFENGGLKMVDRMASVADRYRDALVERYGERGADVEHAEAFEFCEYGAAFEDGDVERLFPVEG